MMMLAQYSAPSALFDCFYDEHIDVSDDGGYWDDYTAVDCDPAPEPPESEEFDDAVIQAMVPQATVPSVMAGASQMVYAALVRSEDNVAFGDPLWAPKQGWIRTRAHIVMQHFDEDGFQADGFRVVFDPPLHLPSRKLGLEAVALRLRLRPDGPDLVTSPVHVSSMNLHLFNQWSHRTDNYYACCGRIPTGSQQDPGGHFQVHVLRSVALPVCAHHLDPTWYLGECMELHRAVSLLWLRQQRAARVMQRAWRHAIACPEHPVCKRRLLSEFCDLI